MSPKHTAHCEFNSELKFPVLEFWWPTKLGIYWESRGSLWLRQKFPFLQFIFVSIKGCSFSKDVCNGFFFQNRGANIYLNLGVQVVMLVAGARQCLLFCQNLGGQLPTLSICHWHPYKLLNKIILNFILTRSTILYKHRNFKWHSDFVQYLWRYHGNHKIFWEYAAFTLHSIIQQSSQPHWSKDLMVVVLLTLSEDIFITMSWNIGAFC